MFLTNLWSGVYSVCSAVRNPGDRVGVASSVVSGPATLALGEKSR